MLECAYCSDNLESLEQYRLHLKVLHNKFWRDPLLCGQNGCPLTFSRFQGLSDHMKQKHAAVNQVFRASVQPDVTSGVASDSDDHLEHAVNDEIHDVGEGHQLRHFYTLVNRIEEGIYLDAAYLIAQLRCHAQIPLTTSLEVMNLCNDFVSEIISGIKEETNSLLREHNVANCERAEKLMQVMSFFEKPFAGLETVHKQNKFFEQRSFFNSPKSVIVGQSLSVGKENTFGKRPCESKLVTVEYISQAQLFRSFLSIPGVFDSIKQYLTLPRDNIIRDFIDGDLWKNHPVRLRHENSPNTLVIPVFDYFDDFEPANPIGTHACVHKVGAKYTVIKGIKPLFNSKLENIFLNMLICSRDRSVFTNKEVFDVYLEEMSNLETKGLELHVDGQTYKVFVTMAQVIGDNLGLNSVLGYIESFTGNFPCRICKMKRDKFSRCFVEDVSCLRVPESYQADVDICNSSLTGIKEQCCYNKIPSFHVTRNVYCDIMHDMLEGICRYVMNKLLHYLIVQKQYFSLVQLNTRMKSFSYDHSSQPPLLTNEQLKQDILILSAMQMLNFVLAFSLMVGDLVPEGDEAWEVYLLMRKLLIMICGIQFSSDQLENMRIVVADFLQEYSRVFKSNLTLKFHNLCHYPMIIRMLGPLYYSWVMRCEGKHWELKKIATNTGNFKNICKTLAIRSQMKQAERFMARRGLTAEISCKKRCITTTLCQVEGGEELSSLLGGYGLYRDIFQVDSISFNGISYNKGDVLIVTSDNIYPEFVVIDRVFLSDSQECYFVCSKLHTIFENHHYQSFQVEVTDDLYVVSPCRIEALPSPWPLKLRQKHSLQYVSVIHNL